MMGRSLLILVMIYGSLLLGETYKITYKRFYNNKPIDDKVIYHSGDFILHSKEDSKERYFVDLDRKVSVKLLKSDEDLYKVEDSFDSFNKPEQFDDTITILDMEGKKCLYDIFSNKIEIYYTTESDAKGGPSYRNFPENSLILKYVVNGNYTCELSAIEEVDDFTLPQYLEKKATIVSEAKYQRALIDSRYKTINVFDREQIYFDGNFEIKPLDDPYQVHHFSKGTVVLRKVKLPEDYYNYYTFLTLTNWSNGDAYDRTGTVFTFSSKDLTFLEALKKGKEELPIFTANNGKEYQGIMKTDSYYPLIDLIRFYTSFGVGHFNSKSEIEGYNWQDSVVYKQEITNLVEDDEIWLGVFIGNYDRGGHKVSLDINLYSGYSEEKVERYVEPLFNTVNIMEMSGQNYGSLFKSDTIRVEVEIPENIKDLQLRFTTTGHGGWGNGDEFTKHVNRIFIDGKEFFRVIPWREDCATYRMSNPASGNFGNGLSSSDLSRANWAPAAITSPYYIPLYDLKSGKHIIELVIDQGDDEGNMSNSWNVSGVLIGDFEK